MNKVFLYLYPIKEYSRVFLGSKENYDPKREKTPYDVINECIEKRYRAKGYTVVWALYPDREAYGVEVKDFDKIIYTDITFAEASGYYEDGREKKIEEIRYPSEKLLLAQLGENVQKAVIGGYHAMDCVRRVGEEAINVGIDAIIDLDLTDFFVSIYRQKDYFNPEQEYSPTKYMEFRMRQLKEFYEEDWTEFEKTEREEFLERYSSPAYGFIKQRSKIRDSLDEER